VEKAREERVRDVGTEASSLDPPRRFEQVRMHTEEHLVGAFENDVGGRVIVLWRGATVGRHFAGWPRATWSQIEILLMIEC
jgi:hypothetical protein